jgi:DNA-binding YbaB/EbfC family protein
MKDFMKMMKQAQELQSRMQQMQSELESMEVEGQSAAGMVKVTLNGKGDVRGLTIDPSLLKPEEAEIVEDLIVAAFQDART